MSLAGVIKVGSVVSFIKIIPKVVPVSPQPLVTVNVTTIVSLQEELIPEKSLVQTKGSQVLEATAPPFDANQLSM